MTNCVLTRDLRQLRAYERFLHDYPEWAHKVVLMQVTSPSPGDSPALATKVSELVDQINGTYGTIEHQPVHHFHQTVDRDVRRFQLVTTELVAHRIHTLDRNTLLSSRLRTLPLLHPAETE